VITLRIATPADATLLFPLTRALNDHEGITVSDATLQSALAQLLGDPALGRIFVIEREAQPIGYGLVTFAFDLEFGGREGWLTELWIAHEHRKAGAGAGALAQIEEQLRGLGVRALHLQVRPDNPAKRLYDRLGWEASPRIVMTRRLA
jgi:GNAT superfamily N-acetyltransferase